MELIEIAYALKDEIESLFEKALEAVLTEEEKQALQGTWYCL